MSVLRTLADKDVRAPLRGHWRHLIIKTYLPFTA
jgi:hypothetical protein